MRLEGVSTNKTGQFVVVLEVTSTAHLLIIPKRKHDFSWFTPS